MDHPEFANEEFYHIYNHGVEGRDLFSDPYDLNRFIECMKEFNSVEPIGSLQLVRRERDESASFNSQQKKPLVAIVSYCLNTNHYHFILEQLVDSGISEFMKRVNGGYSWYFNKKYKRRGTLFEGKYKAKHISTNEYLLHLSAYVNLNYKIHHLSKNALYCSSLEEYIKPESIASPLCKREIISAQFKNPKEYETFAIESAQSTIENREIDETLEALLME